MDVPRLSNTEIDEAAHALLSNCFGTGAITYPVDLDELIYEYLYRLDDLRFSDEEDLGVDSTGDEILGIMMPRSRRILITSRLTGDRLQGRRRFTIAHEIGHWKLHRHHLLAFLDHPSLFDEDATEEEPLVSHRRSVFPRGSASSVGRQEYQANRFAIALLVDPAALRAELEGRFDSIPLYRHRATAGMQRSSLREFSTAVASYPTRNSRAISEVFGLSRLAMAIVLEEYGFVLEMEPLL